jgi:rod shape determining protein RodA
LQGNLIQQNFVPYPYSDSIFVVIGEEFGFLGVVVVLLIYFALIFRLMQIAHQTEDLRGKYVIIGIVSMFVFQVFENVGMLMGIMPLTGITLPFISYGGTSLFLNMLSLGLVMSIKMKTEDLPDHIS